MNLQDILSGRRSVKTYDPKHEITDDELKHLFSQVVLSPSSYNIQPWRFVVVRDPKRKAELRKAAFNQPQVEEASAAIVVVGKLNAFEDAETILAEAPADVRTKTVPMIHGSYAGKPQFQRDEAIRSASLAAMTLMLVAYDMGYATGPMIGFDPEAVGKLVSLDKQHVPIMLVVVGKQRGQLRPRAMRWSLETVVRLETMDGVGLS